MALCLSVIVPQSIFFFFKPQGTLPQYFHTISRCFFFLPFFVMRLLKASCHLGEGPAAASDKWIIDGIHPEARLGQ